jgi:hypothetical protein
MTTPTIDTLDQFSLQEIFEFVAKHLLTQKEPALDESGDCVYRGENNLKCAVGCLIPDSLYRSEIEYVSFSYLNSFFPSISNYPQKCRNLVCSLQDIHDGQNTESWYEQICILAESYELDTTSLKEFENV